MRSPIAFGVLLFAVALAGCGQTLSTQLPDSSKTPPKSLIAEEREKGAKAMRELAQKKDVYREQAIKEIEQAH